MMLREACKSRRISKIDAQTPLLVPSFSSVVCDIPSEMYAKLKDHIADASLFSAYDLLLGKVTQEDIWVSDVVFIDSGNYEIQHIKNALKQIGMTRKPREWTLEIYSSIVDSLRPPSFTKAILVSYDMKKVLSKQISSASSFFARHKQFATCFLCKPCDESSTKVDVKSLVENVASIDQFDVLGLTEKELGNSLLSRCTNILEIRKALNSRGSTIPIHVFGCLDPVSIISYFFCGADIFDGTLWLKYGFHNNAAFYLNNYALLTGKWMSTDAGVLVISWILNLEYLRKLMSYMRRYTQDQDGKVFGFDPKIMEQITDLTSTAASCVR